MFFCLCASLSLPPTLTHTRSTLNKNPKPQTNHKQYLGTSWLWDKVRVVGGAYGGFCSFDSHSGQFTYLSYRGELLVFCSALFLWWAPFSSVWRLPLGAFAFAARARRCLVQRSPFSHTPNKQQQLPNTRPQPDRHPRRVRCLARLPARPRARPGRAHQGSSACVCVAVCRAVLAHSPLPLSHPTSPNQAPLTHKHPPKPKTQPKNNKP